jgi:hypothetical protein
MKIGILTIHHATNYGAVWQAYALSRYLTNAGHEVETIDYRPPVAVKWYHQGFRFGRHPNVVRTLQYLSFQRFIRSHMPLAKPECSDAPGLAAVSHRYDAIVAGSDQIWCTAEGSFRGYDPNFFLAFCDSGEVRKVSYAASAGNTKDFGEHSEEIGRQLGGFQALSVRDQSTAALVESVSGRKPAVVLDPVFLHDFKEVTGDVRQTNDLVIFADQPRRFDSIAKTLARRYGLRIVSLVLPSNVADDWRRIVTPVEWLRRMKGARIVLTDFFHGTAVSLQFGIPVVVASPANKTRKIMDLLRRVNLLELYLGANNSLPDSIFPLFDDASVFSAEIGRRLQRPKQESERFLADSFAMIQSESLAAAR